MTWGGHGEAPKELLLVCLIVLGLVLSIVVWARAVTEAHHRQAEPCECSPIGE